MDSIAADALDRLEAFTSRNGPAFYRLPVNPGTIRLEVDATDLGQRVFKVRQTVPVRPGLQRVHYPAWLPGNHAASGAIEKLAGLGYQDDLRFATAFAAALNSLWTKGTEATLRAYTRTKSIQIELDRYASVF